ncbi:MAG: gamma-glutamyltransferase [Candidatus Aminicenantes bacterium]
MNKPKLIFPWTKTSFSAVLLLLALSFSCGPTVEEGAEPPADRHQPFNYVGRTGMVVAAHPLAAQAGRDMLKDGGNAVDAAVATAFALNAAEPFASGIGGGGFMVIYLAKEDRVTFINFREKAPSRAFPEMFLENGETNEELRRTHGLAVAVPGALAGWDFVLSKYGTRSLGQVMQKGVEIAEHGFELSDTFSKINKDEYEKLLKNSGEDCCYLNDGFPFEPGDFFRNPDLAATFKQIAAGGIEEFYRGEIAKKIVTAVQEKGGLLSPEDLADYRPVERKPLKGTYKEFTLYSIGPPGSGGLHIIQLLNIAENWPVRQWGHNTPVYIHNLSEAFRFVFADRNRYLGDPDYVSIPVSDLISKDYAARIAAQIQPDHCLKNYPSGEFDERDNAKDNTTHLCVLDKDGNIVSLTQSINHFFGSGILPENTGFLLNNHMDDFSRNPESPNAARPHRRPVSSMAPMIVFKGDRPFLVLGSPGGTRIFPSLTQIILNVIAFRMSLDEAIEAPRFFSYSVRGKPRNLYLESRIPPGIRQSLEDLGHTLTVRNAYDKYFGGAQGIMILFRKKTIHGGADSRRDGYGAGY